MEITFRTRHEETDTETIVMQWNDKVRILMRDTIAEPAERNLCDAIFDKKELGDLIGQLLHLQSKMRGSRYGK